MITIYDLHTFVSTVQPVWSAVDFDAISIAIGPKNMNNGEFNCRGIYSWGKRIVVSSHLSKKVAFAVFLHELGHHLVWLQFGTDFCRTFSKYEHELLADKFALEVAEDLGFDYERWIGRKVGSVSKRYSREYN